MGFKTTGNSVVEDGTLTFDGGSTTDYFYLNADPIGDLGAVTKQYVDNQIVRVPDKGPSRFASTINLDASYEYINGLLTQNGTPSALVLDGHTPNAGDRVLIKNQISEYMNGIYVVGVVGSPSQHWQMIRAGDYDSSIEIYAGSSTYVTEGDTLANTLWVMNNPTTPFVIGVTPVTFIQQGAGGSVTIVTSTPADGVTLNITNASTTPDITPELGDITPDSVKPANLSPNVTVVTDGTGKLIDGPAQNNFSVGVWQTVTATTQAMLPGNGYIANAATLLTFTLPTNFAIGEVIEVMGLGAGGWKIEQNSGQTIYLGNNPTTTGTGGYLASETIKDAVRLVGLVANTSVQAITSDQLDVV